MSPIAGKFGIEKMIDDDPELALLCHSTMVKIKEKFYDRPYVDIITQPYHGYSLGEAYAFLQVHAAIGSGKIIQCTVEVGSEPHKDKEVEKNNRLLNNLPKPFVAEFWGGLADEDGFVEWNKAIVCDQFIKNVRNSCICKAEKAPLEVGYTDDHTTLYHLGMDRCLARWPYNSNYIHILVLIDDKLWKSSVKL
ncbi:MAG: hypothetical protein HQ568_10290 [Calditrichaeota bacterium]|nr:hypothetical protein [Calditrichota bacterium]